LKPFVEQGESSFTVLSMYDVIIIGAGPAGLSAAMWCDELGLDTLVLEQASEVGGQLLWVHNAITNYIGLAASNGAELRDRFAKHIEDAEFDLWTDVRIEQVDLKARRIELQSGEKLSAITIIIATGIRRRNLGIPGETEFSGRGIIESAARDRDLFAGKDVCVVGGGDAAAENALYLAEVCPTVTIVHRGKTLRARQEFVERIKGEHCITVFTDAELQRILGNENVEAVEILRKGAVKPFQMAVGGVLIRIGVQPNTEIFANQIEMDKLGYLVIDARQETSIENVFAIGDVSNPISPTVSSATGAGANAAKAIAARLNSR
jgi:thioredoxin reductase (NADPH)